MGNRTALGLALCWLIAAPVQAHSFGRLYTLPLPFWMYAWGAGITLLVSFLLIGWRMRRPAPQPVASSQDISASRFGRVLLSHQALGVAQWLSLFGLLLCIATGLVGTRNAYLNFNMTFFWVVFVLGFTYLSALSGNLWPALNPWQTLTRAAAALWPRLEHGRWRYPKGLSHWPAVALYMAFIWIELFGRSRPYPLSLTLLAYTAINLAGAWAFGSRDWFRNAEFFGLLFRLFAKMAPLEWRRDGAGAMRLRLRAPLAGLTQRHAGSISEVVFLLFILSSTAYDGLRETEAWTRLYWEDIASLLQPWTGESLVQAYPVLKPLNMAFQSGVLLLSPFLYLAAYLACLAAARRWVHAQDSVRVLALRFAYSLLPIALVYHFTHYWTLLVTQGLMVLRLASDPFGAGWNLFGTAHWLPRPVIPDMDWVWHSQVWLIVAGHVLSVLLAHREALQLFGDRRRAALSQLPMLVLMVALTCFGLWILSQPLTSTRMPV